MQSLHADTRFTSSFILPLAIIAARIFDYWTGKWDSAVKTFIAFSLLSGISLASMWSYYLMPLDIQMRFFDIKSLNKTYRLGSAGETFPVRKIVSEMNDYEVFLFGSSNISHHYDPLFRDDNSLLKPLVHDGSVFDIQDGYYNMTNPSSLVYPEVNGSTLFERIPVSENQKLLDFINRRPSDWKLPLTQILLDWVAGLTVLFNNRFNLVIHGIQPYSVLEDLRILSSLLLQTFIEFLSSSAVWEFGLQILAPFKLIC